MLLMVRTEPAVMRASLAKFAVEGERDRSGFVVAAERDISFGIAIDKRLKWPAIRAALAHIDLVVPQQDLRVDHFPAIRANAARQLEEDIIRVPLLRDRRSSGISRFIGRVHLQGSCSINELLLTASGSHLRRTPRDCVRPSFWPPVAARRWNTTDKHVSGSPDPRPSSAVQSR